MQEVIQQVVLTVLLVSMMLAMGLRLTVQDLVTIIKDVRLIGLVVVVNFIVLPLLTLVFVNWVGVTGDAAAGILLCSAAPGATMTTILSRQAHGDIPVSVALLLVLVFISTLLTPLIATGLFHMAGLHPERMRAGMAILSLLAIQILPLIAGMVVRHKWVSLAAKWEPAAARFASITLGVVIVAMCIINFDLVEQVGAVTALTIGAIVAVSSFVGWFVPGSSNVRVSASLATGAQNIALATLLADRYLSNTGLLTVLIFGMMTYVVLIPLVVMFRRRVPHPV